MGDLQIVMTGRITCLPICPRRIKACRPRVLLLAKGKLDSGINDHMAGARQCLISLEKAKLFKRCLLRLQVSNRGGSHQALNIDIENCRQLAQCFPNKNGNSSRPRSPLVLA